jgi:RNA polymerase sigma-70 factor (ECF subfamily)
VQFCAFDESYLDRLCSGDFSTEAHFVAYFSELIRLKLRSRLRSPQAIADLRQETFARVFATLRGKSRVRNPERLGAFVNSVCNNVLLDYYRSTLRDNPIEDTEDSDFPDTSEDVIGVISRKETAKKVCDILDELPERDHRLLKEIFLEERDRDAVCQTFGVDRDYLRVLLHRAKMAFKSLYLKSTAEGARATTADCWRAPFPAGSQQSRPLLVAGPPL